MKKIITSVVCILFILFIVLLAGFKLFPYIIEYTEKSSYGSYSFYEIREAFKESYDVDNYSELMFYSSLEEALANSDFVLDIGRNQAIYNYKTPNQVIKRFENENAAVLVYTARVTDNSEAFITCRFNKKNEGGVEQYAYVISRADVYNNNKRWHIIEPNNAFFKQRLRLHGTIDYYSINESLVFVDGFSEDPNVHNLTINQKAPKEIIPFVAGSQTLYYWYYDDIDIHTPINELDIQCK